MFYGHMHWTNEELKADLDEKLWDAAGIVQDTAYVLSTIKTIARNDYGIQAWNMLNSAINQGAVVATPFEDSMLQEWSLANLPLTRSSHPDAETFEEEYAPSRAGGTYDIKVGTILRGSSASHSPFLLSDQQHHHSLLLIIQDDNIASVGVLLNLPSTETAGIHIASCPEAVFGEVSPNFGSLPVRYGGPLDSAGTADAPLLCLHKSKSMKDAGYGDPLGPTSSAYNIWRCDLDEAVEAVNGGIASADEFIVVSGVCVWEKDGFGGGLRAELVQGHYEKVPIANHQSIWDLLTTQELLSTDTLDDNLRISKEAWVKAGAGKASASRLLRGERKTLADQALFRWVLARLVRLDY